MDGAEYEHYEYEPGPRLGERVSGAWRRAFGGWAPDQRSVGLLLAALYLTGLLSQLVLVDFAWFQFTQAIALNPRGPGLVVQDVVFSVARLLDLPMLALVVAGGVGLALRRGWGRWLAVAGLAALLLIRVVETVVSVTTIHAPIARFTLSDVVDVIVSVLPLVVLLWSRPAPVDA
jgi:hypothetical protein